MKRAGIIGCGSIAGVHAWVLRNMPDVEIAAFCDIAEDKARKLAGDTGGAVICTDWRGMAGMGLDTVHVCTPHFLHAPMAAELLRAGIPVFLEKPCAISREQFAELKQASEIHRGRLGICFQNRYNETTRCMERLIRENRIGDVTGGRAFVTWRRDEDYYDSSPWKGRLETEGGGVLINQAIHTLDLLLFFLGRPSEVRAATARHHLPERIGVEDTAEAWMAFPDGKRACFYASNGYAADAPVLLEIQGSEGRAMISGNDVILQDRAGMRVFTPEQKQGIGKGYWGSGHEACIRDFYRCLDTGERFQADLEGTENTFDVMMRIYGK